MMKFVVTKRLLPLFLAVSACTTSVRAEYSKKTFMMPRPVGMNKAMEFSPWHATMHHNNEPKKKGIHSRLQVTPFYQASTNRGDVGKYFGVGNGSNSFSVGVRYNIDELNPVVDALASNAADVDGILMSGFEDQNNLLDPAVLVPHTFRGNVTFNPSQEIWGARVDLEYFSHAKEGLYFHVGMPFASVSNSMNMKIANGNKVQIAIDGNGDGVGSFYTLADYLAGKVVIGASPVPGDSTSRRDALNKSKIAGRTTQGGLADIDFTLGHRTTSEKVHYAGNLRLTLPTGNRPSGCDLFEAVLGNGHHVGLGAGWDLGFQVWKNQDCKMYLEAGLQYTYLFKDEEVRMLGVKGFEAVPAFPQYMLMGAVHGAVADGVAIFPAANELTRALKVTPGSHIDALLDVSFHMKSFVFDVGYNMFWRGREKVSVVSWEDETYGIFTNTFNTNDEAKTGMEALKDNTDVFPLFLDGKLVNRNNLDVAAAETPDQLTHKMHVGLNYRGACCSLPSSVGVGGSFEFPSSNAALAQYAIWLKGSISW